MSLYSTFLTTNFWDEYEKVLKLIDCKTDPESEPYKSKYKASDILKELKKKVSSNSQIDNETESDKYDILTSILYFHIGSICFDCEEISDSKVHFENSLNLIESKPIAVGIKLILLNQLGILFSSLSELDKSIVYLEKAQQVFIDYNMNENEPPNSILDFVFENRSEKDQTISKKCFEDSFTLTLYYLAQVYGNKGDSDLSAEYIKRTLTRQLAFDTYAPLKWALDAAALSQYFVSHAKFTTARKCLAAAEHLLKTDYAKQGDKPEADEVVGGEEDTHERVWASVARCWTKYTIELLDSSWQRLQKLPDDYISGGDVEEVDDNSDHVDFKLDCVEEERRVTASPVLDFAAAREVFKVGVDWVRKSLTYFVIDGYCSDFVEITQDHSQLFKHLANFETDDGRRAKMHKRRADLLNPLVAEISKQYYMLVYRQLTFELGEIYGAILDVKLTALEQYASAEPAFPTTTASGAAVRKVNELISRGLHEFNAYVKTLRDAATDKLPAKLDSDDERPCMVAHFYNARLYSKFVTSNVDEKAKNLNLSISCYRFIVDYCALHESARVVMKAELALCEEMIVLLPAKIRKIQREAAEAT